MKIGNSILEFKNAREVMIFEIAHTLGMVKREIEMQNEETISIFLQDKKYSSIISSSESRVKLHSEKWLQGMVNNCERVVKLVNKYGATLEVTES